MVFFQHVRPLLKVRAIGSFIVSMLISGLAHAEYALNFQEPVTDVARDIYGLHMTIFYICVAIFVAVFAVMFYSIFKHRKSQGAVAADFHESTTVEIIWTIVPLVILIVMAIPAAKVLIQMEDFSDSEMSIKVTGYQWRWEYDYLDEGIKYYSQLDPAHNVARQANAGIDVEQFEHYLKEVDNPLGCACWQEDSFSAYRRRCYPLLVGARFGRKERFHPRLYQ